MTVEDIFKGLPPSITWEDQELNWSFTRMLNGVYRIYYGTQVYGESKDPNEALKQAINKTKEHHE